MPKNQFQRPTPVRHSHDVPRHGKARPPLPKAAGKLVAKAPSHGLPPLATLLEKGAGQ